MNALLEQPRKASTDRARAGPARAGRTRAGHHALKVALVTGAAALSLGAVLTAAWFVLWILTHSD